MCVEVIVCYIIGCEEKDHSQEDYDLAMIPFLTPTELYTVSQKNDNDVAHYILNVTVC